MFLQGGLFLLASLIFTFISNYTGSYVPTRNQRWFVTTLYIWSFWASIGFGVMGAVWIINACLQQLPHTAQ